MEFFFMTDIFKKAYDSTLMANSYAYINSV